MTRQQLPPQIRKIVVLEKKSGKEVTRYELRADGGVNPATGQRQQVKRRFATERAARDALAEIGGSAAAGAFVARKPTTVGQVCSDWLASLHDARATTRNAYAYALAPLREQYGDMPVQRLTRPDLDKLLTALCDGGTVTAKGNARHAWSARSVNKALDAWRALLDYAAECGEVSRNVTTGMRKVARSRKEMATYTPAEIATVLGAADRDRNGHLWYLALSGLRRGEIAGLMVDRY
jgi:integrase